MESLQEKILRVLKKSGLRIDRSDFEFSTETGKIGAILVSGNFDGLDEMERQELVWNHLKAGLAEDDLNHIISLITVTTEEERLFKEQA